MRKFSDKIVYSNQNYNDLIKKKLQKYLKLSNMLKIHKVIKKQKEAKL